MPDWSSAPTSMQTAATSIFALLAIVIVILFAVAFVRVVTGRSLDSRDDD